MFERNNELEKHLSDPEVIADNTRYTVAVEEKAETGSAD